MRNIAIALNLLVIGSVIYLVWSSESEMRGKDLALAVLFISGPIASLLAFYVSSGDGWLSFFLKRKALEEKAKFDRLNETKASLRKMKRTAMWTWLVRCHGS